MVNEASKEIMSILDLQLFLQWMWNSQMKCLKMRLY